MAVVAGVFLLVRDELPWSFRAPALRENPGRPSTEFVAAFSPRRLGNGGVELRWRRMPSAEVYRVRLLDAGLQEVLELKAGPDTLLILDPSLLAQKESAVFWQVEAFSQGDRIADSAPTRLPTRPGR